MKALTMAAFLTLASGCVVRVGPGYPPSQHPPPDSFHGEQIVRAKEVRAGSVRARVIYAKEVKAKNGRVGRIFEGETEEWERGRTDDKIETSRLDTDIIYAKEVDADWVEAAEIHAKKVRIGRR
jgi:hypothetical protein